MVVVLSKLRFHHTQILSSSVQKWLCSSIFFPFGGPSAIPLGNLLYNRLRSNYQKVALSRVRFLFFQISSRETGTKITIPLPSKQELKFQFAKLI